MRAWMLAAVLVAAGPALAASPLPFEVGGPFALIDQHGAPQSNETLSGQPLMLFFGYAECQAICSVALPRLAETVELLETQGIEVTPVLITVDPARDTPAALKRAAPKVHPRLIALTGDEEALAAARRSFRVESKEIGEDIAGPIYAHGSFVYLIDEGGDVLTLMPPILGAERMAEIAAGYLE